MSKKINDAIVVTIFKEFKRELNLSRVLTENSSKFKIIHNDGGEYWAKILQELDVIRQRNLKIDCDESIGFTNFDRKTHFEVSYNDTRIQFDFNYNVKTRITFARVEELSNLGKTVLYVISCSTDHEYHKVPFRDVLIEQVDSLSSESMKVDNSGIKATLAYDNGALIVYANGRSYEFASREGQPSNILKEVASRENIGKTYTRKDLKSKNIIVSRSLNKVFKSSVIMKELAPFVKVNVDSIVVNEEAYLTENELKKIEKKAIYRK